MRALRSIRSCGALCFLIFTFGSAAAQSCSGAAGSWVVALGQRNFLVLTVVSVPGSQQAFTGSLTHPDNFQTNNSSFSHIHGAIQTKPIVTSVCKNGSLLLTFRDPANAVDKDIFLFTQKNEEHATLQLVGFPMSPFDLTRAKGKLQVANDWVEAKTYSPDDDLPSNPEMKRIFDEDQRVRQPGTAINWTVVGKSDAERRAATEKLLQAGALHTGEDFTWAAFLFQHGDTPNDYLMAHTLALVALKKGSGDALWIATATLDRYLQSIHQSQIYGTQYKTLEDKPTTQEPYERSLISDALRRELGVPIKSAQEEQRKQYDVERKLVK